MPTKTYDCQVRTKDEMTTDLMFKEIMELRNNAAELSTALFELYDAVLSNSTDIKHKYVLRKAQEAKDKHNSIK